MYTKSQENFLNFLRKHNLYDEDLLAYINNHTIIFDYLDEDRRKSIGIYSEYDKESKLRRFTLCLPSLNSPEAELITIHFYINAIELFNHLGTTYTTTKESKILPMLYEKIYLSEYPSTALKNYIISLDKEVRENSDIDERIALAVQPELLKYYQEKNPSYKKLVKKAKKLSQKYYI